MLANPTDATLAAARKAWVAARPAYLVTETFRFYDGPIEELEGQINAWPMNEAFIDYVEGKPERRHHQRSRDRDLDRRDSIAKNQVTDEADVTTGWHAIEFLLWGQDLNADGPGNRPVSDYIAGQGQQRPPARLSEARHRRNSSPTSRRSPPHGRRAMPATTPPSSSRCPSARRSAAS